MSKNLYALLGFLSRFYQKSIRLVYRGYVSIICFVYSLPTLQASNGKLENKNLNNKDPKVKSPPYLLFVTGFIDAKGSFGVTIYKYKPNIGFVIYLRLTQHGGDFKSLQILLNHFIQTLLNRSYGPLDRALTSPPKPYSFVSLPLQSSCGAGFNQFKIIILYPSFITGFCDGESSFSVNLAKNDNSPVGYFVICVFSITLHKKDEVLLESIKAFFNNAGNIYKDRENYLRYCVSSAKDIEIIIKHFDKYPLVTQKKADFELFKKVFYLVSNKKHLTTKGLSEIVAIKASINTGLSDKLKKEFTSIVPALRPLIGDQKIYDPYLLAGLMSAEGCFYIDIFKRNDRTKPTYSVNLKMCLGQNIRDRQLINSLIAYLGCGRLSISEKQNFSNFIVTKLSDILDKVIPFFNEYPVQGVKALDFADFKRAAELIKDKRHLTEEGLKELFAIKSGMNSRRLFSSSSSTDITK